MDHILSFLIVVFAAYIVILMLWKVLVKSLLHFRSILVEGHIIDSRQVRTYRGVSTQYYLSYSYRYNDRAYTHKEKVDEATYYIWSVGDKVDVSCFPKFARVARLMV